MKKIKPILFSTPMVQAILNDRKTQTRRIIKETPGVCIFCGCTDEDCCQCIEKTGKPCSWLNQDETVCSACWDFPTDKAKYQVDDVLWVRETFKLNNPYGTPEYSYKADWDTCNTGLKLKWKPSIFMPRAAARIFLKVTNVRAERLQDISDTDAIAEGIALQFSYLHQKLIWKDYLKASVGWDYEYAVFSFQSLWESINGQKSWAENPWVWVYDFEWIEKPENFM